MSRQPVHLNPQGKLTGRDAIWATIRKLKQFTVIDIERVISKTKVRIADETIKSYLRGLTKADYLQVIDGVRLPDDPAGRYIRKRWELIRDIGVDAPRVTKNGKPVTQGCKREQMWRTMRIISSFDFRDLAIHASTDECKISESDAKHYTRYLAKAGYLVQVYQPINNKGIPARHRLLASKFTGPKPPMIQRIRQVYDPNLGQVVWPMEGEA